VAKLFTVGVPSASLCPARPRKFKELTGLTELAIPVRGSYPADFSKQGTYDICPEPGVFLFGLVTEALLAHRVYPDLKDDQLYIIAGVELEEDTLTVVGRVVEVVEE
jgi:hypothetical protein